MKTTAVICEYNPFHKGHKLQIDAIKQRGSLVVCIMSGGFVQRGIPAIYDKYVRARCAVSEGADLVVELPYPYSCSAAEFFAFGGVGIADSLGCVDELCFGSECGDLDRLKAVSARLLSDEYVNELKKARKDDECRNKPYAVLREEVYGRLYGDELPGLPNDILGGEYISALERINSSIIPVTYKREKGYSATESRRLINEENNLSMLPGDTLPLLKNADVYRIEYAERAILAHYRNADPKELEKYEGMTNGIADRLVKASLESRSFDELMEKTAGKGYTNAKIRRCILHGMTGVTTDMLKCRPGFTRVLACNGHGRELVRKIQKHGNIALLSKPAHYKRLEGKAFEQAEIDIRADILLTLMCKDCKRADEFLKKTPYLADL